LICAVFVFAILHSDLTLEFKPLSAMYDFSQPSSQSFSQSCSSLLAVKTAQELAPVAAQLLERLIALPSPSREEDKTAEAIQEFLHERAIPTERMGNNVWSCNRFFDPAKPTILLNSHHDTVKPVAGWTMNPFEARRADDGKIFGLGSNDAGGALCALLTVFWRLYERADMPCNLIMAASAEEEIIGKNGVESILPRLGKIWAAIVGEPTACQMAIAEKGLMVLDCVALGVAGHAARDTGVNAISKAIRCIERLHEYRFARVSSTLGAVKMTVAVINGGSQHNVIPDRCSFVVDVRTTDAYSHEEILDILRGEIDCEITPRSVRLRPSSLPPNHEFARAAAALDIPTFASATLSDQSVMPFPSVKIGPGVSERSHTADEFIYYHEIEEGITTYLRLLEGVFAITAVTQKGTNSDDKP
jgi:acetylornithine deacetylase